MPDARKKTKTQITVSITRKLLRAVDMQVARERAGDRSKWLTALAEDKLRELGKW